MLYSEYISKAKQICIAIDDVNNVAYMLPDYRYILNLSGLKISDVTDFNGLTDEIVAENLKLEVEAYNARHNAVPAIASFLMDMILNNLSPVAVEEQNQLVSNIIDYMKTKENIQKNKLELKEAQNKIQQTMETGINNNVVDIKQYLDFSKK